MHGRSDIKVDFDFEGAADTTAYRKMRTAVCVERECEGERESARQREGEKESKREGERARLREGERAREKEQKRGRESESKREGEREKKGAVYFFPFRI